MLNHNIVVNTLLKYPLSTISSVISRHTFYDKGDKRAIIHVFKIHKLLSLIMYSIPQYPPVCFKKRACLSSMTSKYSLYSDLLKDASH